jgi:hypothetical protein
MKEKLKLLLKWWWKITAVGFITFIVCWLVMPGDHDEWLSRIANFLIVSAIISLVFAGMLTLMGAEITEEKPEEPEKEN